MTFSANALLRCTSVFLLLQSLPGKNASVLIYDPLNGGASSGFYNADGTFSYSLIPVNAGFTNAPLGDFNGDSKADIVFYNSSTALGYLGLETAGGAFSFNSLFWSAGYTFVKTGDFNHDGKTDFLLYNGTTGTMYVALAGNTGSGCTFDGNFSYCHVSLPSGGPFTNVVVADFNGDGYADVFLYNAGNAQASLGVSNGSGGLSFNSIGGLSAGYGQEVTGDLNHDGKADLVLYNSGSGQTATGMSTGSNFTFASQRTPRISRRSCPWTITATDMRTWSSTTRLVVLAIWASGMVAADSPLFLFTGHLASTLFVRRT